jgi:hypothetical protein
MYHVESRRLIINAVFGFISKLAVSNKMHVIHNAREYFVEQCPVVVAILDLC